MKTIVYSHHDFERAFFNNVDLRNHELFFTEQSLSPKTVALSAGFEAVSLFANDDASGPVLELLAQNGIRYIALRSAGYNHVDLEKAKQLGIHVSRVPAYSPHSVAEHAITLMLSLNRRLTQSHFRITGQNFLLDGLTGFDMNGKTAGIIGTGKIGSTVARILFGFGCRVLAFDKEENEEIKERYRVEYVDIETLYRNSDIITLHLPLTEKTKYFINQSAIDRMKPGVMLINTARGSLIETNAVIPAIKNGHIGYFGMDVYEHEHDLFFKDRSNEILQDDTFARLMTFPNVLITAHQGFLTETALKNIVETTLHNLDCYANGQTSENELIDYQLLKSV